jgi:hypothetical protein
MSDTQITKGTRVAMSRAFLRSTHQLTGHIPFRRGEVLNLIEIGGIPLVRIKWDKEKRPTKVLMQNLVREDRIHLEPV